MYYLCHHLHVFFRLVDVIVLMVIFLLVSDASLLDNNIEEILGPEEKKKSTVNEKAEENDPPKAADDDDGGDAGDDPGGEDDDNDDDDDDDDDDGDYEKLKAASIALKAALEKAKKIIDSLEKIWRPNQGHRTKNWKHVACNAENTWAAERNVVFRARIRIVAEINMFSRIPICHVYCRE